MANRIRIAYRDFLMSSDRMVASRPRNASPVERRSPFGTPGSHTLRVSMKCQSGLHKLLPIIMPVVLLLFRRHVQECIDELGVDEIVAIE